jgi:hypothetical protein
MSRFFAIFFCLFVVVGCSPTPEGTVTDFFNAANDGNSEKVAGLVCGDFPIIPLPRNWLRNPVFQLMDKNDSIAHVNAKGEVWITTGSVGIKKSFDLMVAVNKDRDKWCISKDSVWNFVQELVKPR